MEQFQRLGYLYMYIISCFIYIGHKSKESLLNYNPTSTLERREERAVALQTRNTVSIAPAGTVPESDQTGSGTVQAGNEKIVDLVAIPGGSGMYYR